MEATATNIIDLRQQLLDDVWQRAHSKWRDAKMFFDREHPIKKITNARAIRLSLARSKILSFVDTMITDKPMVDRKVYADPRHERTQDEVELWSQGGLRELGMARGLQPPFKSMALNLGLYGYSNYAIRWLEGQWPKKPAGGNNHKEAIQEYERKRKSFFPFELLVPHPARILMPPFEREPSFAIETVTHYVHDWVRYYPSLEGKLNTHRLFDLVEGIIYHSSTEFALVIEQDRVLHRANMLGFIPYSQAYNSRGTESAPVYGVSGQGAVNAGANPADFAVGMLEHLQDSITARDEFITAKHCQSQENMYAQRFITGPDAEPIADQLKEHDDIGAIVVAPNSERSAKDLVAWAQPPPPDPESWRVDEQFERDLTQGTFGGEVQGFRSPGVATATQHSLMLGLSRQGFDVAVQQLNYMGAKVLEHMWRMIEARGDTVWVDDISMTGAKLEGNYHSIVNFNRDDEATILRRKADAREEYDRNLIDDKAYHDAAGRGNGVEMADRAWLSREMKAEAIQAFIWQAAESELRQEYGLPPMLPGPGPEVPAAPGVRSRNPTPFVPTGMAPTAEEGLARAREVPAGDLIRAGA
mgnify:CR=1 FL=1